MNQTDKWATAALRIHSTVLSAQKITEALKTEPTSIRVKGELLSPRNPRSAVCEAHLWVLESGLDARSSIENHITQLVQFIEQKLPILEALMKDCNIDLFCGYSSGSSQGGIMLEANLMKRLAIIPIDLMIDIYASEPRRRKKAG